MSTPVDASKGPLACARCAVALERGRGECYFVEIRTVADPAPPVLTDEDLRLDAELAIAELVSRLRLMTEEQLLRQVHDRRLYTLCARCHAEWVVAPFGETEGGEAHDGSWRRSST